MKVLILSTFGHYGGAATCSKRLYLALKKQGVDVDLRVVQFYDGYQIKSILKDSFFNKLKVKVQFIRERLQVLFRVSDQRYLYKFSPGLPGLKLSDHPIVLNADIIHLHWVNFGFVSIPEIAALAKMKTVIWTQHDMWSFTGGCHYALHCENYQSTCEDCFYLKNSSFSKAIQANKINIWSKNSFKLLTTSHWLGECAAKSKIFNDWDVDILPTPIDTTVFKPMDKPETKQKYDLGPDEFYVLFGAVDLNDERKGFRYLVEALNMLKERIPNMHLITFGKQAGDVFDGKVTELGHIDSEEKLNEIYNLADVFVLPSIQDNLPNTVMEALSCAVPVVAFDCGGVSDMITHQVNGFLAPNKNSKALAEGIGYFKDEEKRATASVKAREKVVSTFSEEVVVPKYLVLYNQTIK
ncbi:MAG: glycosyltransferase [Cyclobacteriaceae bacterium]